MTDTPSEDTPNPNSQPVDLTGNFENLLQLLRHKEGNWVEWGRACQQLQSGGYKPQAIFEATGFEPVQQNQIIVASQVYTTIINTGVSAEVQARLLGPVTDILYELRVLTQKERATAAEFVLARNLDADGAREVAKAIKEFSRYGTPPTGFTDNPGDTVAYQYWRRAREQSGLQERSRLIARGLMFAHTQTARQQIEQLLTGLPNTAQRPAPRLPLYRLEEDDELPRIIPVAGQLPLTPTDLENIPVIEKKGRFHQLMQSSWKGGLVALPGWQVVSTAQHPIALICHTSQLPTQLTGKSEDVLVVIDYAQQEWVADSYFVVDQSGQLQFQWFPDAPEVPLLGKMILVLRPKKIVDEEMSNDIWQLED